METESRSVSLKLDSRESPKKTDTCNVENNHASTLSEHSCETLSSWESDYSFDDQLSQNSPSRSDDNSPSSKQVQNNKSDHRHRENEEESLEEEEEEEDTESSSTSDEQLDEEQKANKQAQFASFFQDFPDHTTNASTQPLAEKKHRPKSDFPPDLETAKKFKEQGNSYFAQKHYQPAIDAYSKAILHCPEQNPLMAILFSNKAACHLSLSEFESAVQDSSESIELNSAFPKAYLRRYRGYMGLKKYHDALNDLKKAIELDSTLVSEYASELKQVEYLSNQQFEEEKKEMMDKLKGFGNWALGKLGLSLDNFKMEQNEQGSYNITFNQNQSSS